MLKRVSPLPETPASPDGRDSRPAGFLSALRYRLRGLAAPLVLSAALASCGDGGREKGAPHGTDVPSQSEPPDGEPVDGSKPDGDGKPDDDADDDDTTPPVDDDAVADDDDALDDDEVVNDDDDVVVDDDNVADDDDLPACAFNPQGYMAAKVVCPGEEPGKLTVEGQEGKLSQYNGSYKSVDPAAFGECAWVVAQPLAATGLPAPDQPGELVSGYGVGWQAVSQGKPCTADGRVNRLPWEGEVYVNQQRARVLRATGSQLFTLPSQVVRLSPALMGMLTQSVPEDGGAQEAPEEVQTEEIYLQKTPVEVKSAAATVREDGAVEVNVVPLHADSEEPFLLDFAVEENGVPLAAQKDSGLFSLTGLTPGLHTLTVKVTAPDGQTAEETVEVTVPEVSADDDDTVPDLCEGRITVEDELKCNGLQECDPLTGNTVTKEGTVPPCKEDEKCKEPDGACVPKEVICGPGQEKQGEICADADGCATGVNPCAPGVVCTDEPAPSLGALCGPCPAGMEGDGKVCADVDGCATDPCFPGVLCTDEPAPSLGALCGPCPAGMEGDGKGPDGCKDIDLCAGKTPDDGNACTVGDICNPLTGNAEPGTPKDCNDGLFCTVDGCNTQTGCQHAPRDCGTGTCDEATDSCDAPPPAPMVTNVDVDCNTGGVCGAGGLTYPVTFTVANATECTASVQVISGLGTPGSVSAVTLNGTQGSFDYTTGSDTTNVIRITVNCTGPGGNGSGYTEVTLD